MITLAELKRRKKLLIKKRDSHTSLPMILYLQGKIDELVEEIDAWIRSDRCPNCGSPAYLPKWKEICENHIYPS